MRSASVSRGSTATASWRSTGPVLRHEAVPVEPRATLEERIHAVEHRLLPEVVRELCAR